MRLRLRAEEAERAFKAMPELRESAAIDGSFVIVELRKAIQEEHPQIHISSGAGTELKRILKSAGIEASGCQCDAHAIEMDAKGIEWCAENDGVIVGWLMKEAKARGLPFVRAAAFLMVWAAIAAARRKTPLAKETRAE